jgi:hypothetical protein
MDELFKHSIEGEILEKNMLSNKPNTEAPFFCQPNSARIMTYTQVFHNLHTGTIKKKTHIPTVTKHVLASKVSR